MKLQCNKCLELTVAKPKKKRLPKEIDKHYFKCDHCSHIYVIGYTDEHIRSKQKKLRKLIKRNNPINEMKINKLQQEIEMEMNLEIGN